MKIDILPPVEISASAVFATESFDIGDKAVIMEILRGKMYSNPIYAIAQEIMCNARDAHREVNKSDVAFEVKLPNKIDPSFQVRDFGPGVSPDRIANVFIKYGNSTKRGDNLQTGGFGLGAKTPFAYGDTFAICSVTPEVDGKLIRRDYIAFLEERRMGKLSLVLEKPADENERQGTTIIVSCKEEDFDEFARSVREVTQYWKVRPKIVDHDGNFEWTNHKILLTGPDGDWYVIENKINYSDAMALIDEIPYRLNLNTIYKGSIPEDIQSLTKAPIRFLFSNGSIKITANREDIDYQPNIIELLKARIQKTANEARDIACKLINEAKNLYQACVAWKTMKDRFLFDSDFVKWQGLEINEQIEVGYRDSNALYHWERIHVNKNGVPQKERQRHLDLKDNIILAEDDTGMSQPSPGKIATLFAKNPTVDDIYTIRFRDKNSQSEFEKKYNWSKYDPIKLSTVERTAFKCVIGAKSDNRQYVKVKRYSFLCGWHNETEADLTTVPGVYVELYKQSAYADSNHRIKLRDIELDWIIKQFKVDVYGIIPSRLSKSAIGPALTKMDEFLAKRKACIERDAEVAKYGEDVDILDRGQRFFNLLSHGDRKNMPELIEFKYRTGVAAQFVKRYELTLGVRAKVKLLAGISRLLVRGESNDEDKPSTKTAKPKLKNKLSVLTEKLSGAYPLIEHIGYISDDIKPSLMNDIRMYVNLRDKQNRKKRPAKVALAGQPST